MDRLTDTIIHDIKDKLEVRFNDIDDVAKLWCFTDECLEKDSVPEMICEAKWKNFHGKNDCLITKNLSVKHKNYLVFGIFNKVYNAFFFKGGKWSYSIELLLNNERIWKKFDLKTDYDEIKEKDKIDGNSKFTFSSYLGPRNDYEKNIIVGLKYWKIIEVNFDKNKKIQISEVIDSEIYEQIKSFMQDENDKFREEEL